MIDRPTQTIVSDQNLPLLTQTDLSLFDISNEQSSSNRLPLQVQNNDLMRIEENDISRVDQNLRATHP